MITKLTKIRGIDYKGGKGVPQLNRGGEKENLQESVWHCNCIKYPSLESR